MTVSRRSRRLLPRHPLSCPMTVSRWSRRLLPRHPLSCPMTVSRRSRRWYRRCLPSKSGRLDRRILPDDHWSSSPRCPPSLQCRGCRRECRYCCLGCLAAGCRPPPIRSSMRTDCPAHHPWTQVSATLAAATAIPHHRSSSSRRSSPSRPTAIPRTGIRPVGCLRSHPAGLPTGLQQSGRQPGHRAARPPDRPSRHPPVRPPARRSVRRPIARLIALPIESHPVTTSRRR